MELGPEASTVGLLIHKGEEKAAGGDLHPGGAKGEVWLVANEHGTFAGPPDWSTIPVGTLAKSHAHWWVAGLLLLAGRALVGWVLAGLVIRQVLAGLVLLQDWCWWAGCWQDW